MKHIWLGSLVGLLVFSLSTPAAADLRESLRAAMVAESRPDADQERDANRRPIETLEFFGLQEDMRALELVPGGGWYTRLLAPALAQKGKLYLAIGTQRIAELQAEGQFPEAEVLEVEGEFVRPEGSRRFQIDGIKLPVSDLDMVLTFRNLHNFTDAGRKGLNAAVFAALKSGGLYGVIDHTRRHNEGESEENWRRMDPVQMILEIQSAGFELVKSSTLHYRPDDELRYEVGRKTVTGNTDRFTLLFRKP